jgi:hypothetical protein
MFVSFRFGNYCKLARVNDGHTFKDIFRLVNESNLSEGYIYICLITNGGMSYTTIWVWFLRKFNHEILDFRHGDLQVTNNAKENPITESTDYPPNAIVAINK